MLSFINIILVLFYNVHAYNVNNALGFSDEVYQCSVSQKLLTTHILSSASKRNRYLVSVAGAP